jgi:ligand-binding sensor domain-containing protein/two-component sensor histidine kinase
MHNREGRFFAMALVAWCSLGTLRAVDPDRTMSQYVRQRWGVEHGFPRGPVYSIEQTESGYLWIATAKGLIRFDGLTFHTIDSAKPEQPTLSYVLGLIADAQGTLWLRLRHPGLTLLRYSDEIFHGALGELATRVSVTAMTRGLDGAPLFCLLEGESSRMVVRDSKFQVLASLPGVSVLSPSTIAQTANGDIWVGTNGAGLYRIHHGQAVAVTESLPDPKINALVPAGNNELWVGTDAGIVRWDGTRLTQAGVPRSLAGVQVLSMTVDRDSNLWVGTNSRGLLRVNARGVASLEDSNRPGIEAITALFEDREGNLWIGSASGLERLRDSAFVTYSSPEGVPTGGSNPVLVDSGDRVWFPPVTGGLSWFREQQHGQITNDGLGKDVVYSIAGGDVAGGNLAGGVELWIGRQHGGLTRLRWDQGSVTTKTYTHADGLAQDSVYSVGRARDGSVWAGTLSAGVSKFSNGRFTNYSIANGLASNTVTSILESSDGTMWFATPQGLSSLSNGRWKSFSIVDGLPSASVDCLLEDSGGVLWVGTSSGLAFGNQNGFQARGAALSALREPVLGIAEDRQGSLWMTTSYRVLRLNREKLFRGTLAEGDVREYGLADGLRGIEGVKRHRSVIADARGRIWLSLNSGISVVDPARLKNSSVPALSQLQNITADGSSIALGHAIHVPGGRRRITFGYTGLSLSIPDRVRFRYRLDDFDRDWSETVSTREAVYTNLPPGSYRFRVVASNPDGVWNTSEASTAFEVDPLFWQTWWFRASLGIAFLMAAAALYRFRLHQVTAQLNLAFHERLAERTRIAQELHDTLLQGFLSASMQAHVATDRLPEDSQVKPAFQRTLQLMDQVIEEGRNAVRGLRSSASVSLDLEQAFARIQDEIPASQDGGQIAFRIVVEGHQRALRPLLRDEVYRVGREAIVNAFRHSQAKRIEVELKYSPAGLHLIVRDDGRGIDSEILSKGRDGHFGLSSMRERADRIGAHLHLWSSASAGTEIELSVPPRVAFENNQNDWLSRITRYIRRNTPNENEDGAK